MKILSPKPMKRF